MELSKKNLNLPEGFYVYFRIPQRNSKMDWKPPTTKKGKKEIKDTRVNPSLARGKK